MTKRTRRNHSPDFKAKVALAALKGDKTIAQLSDQYGVHVSQITAWKDQLQASAASAFGPAGAAAAAAGGRHQGTARQDRGVDAGERFLEGALIKAGLLSAKR